MEHVKERLASLETKVIEMEKRIDERLDIISEKVDEIRDNLVNELAHTKERLDYMETEIEKNKGKSDLVNNWVKPIIITLITIFLTYFLTKGGW